MGVLWFSYTSEDTPRAIPGVSPILKKRLRSFALEARRRYSVVAIDHLGIYAERGQRGDISRISSHAYGRAIDIAGFRFTDGTHITVRNHADPTTARRLSPLVELMDEHFDNVVDWNKEPKLHQDHVHAEVYTGIHHGSLVTRRHVEITGARK
jgi:hypothetical protein